MERGRDMKKIVVFGLLLAMLIPMGLTNIVRSAKAETKPFYFVNSMGELGTGAYKFDDPYVYSRVTFSTSRYTGTGELPIYIHLNEDYSDSITVKGISEMAQALKKIFADRPVGTRYIMLYKTIDTNVQPEALIYMDKGVELYAQWAEKFFKEYKSIGGELDGILLDVEYNNTHAFYIKKAYTTGTTIIGEDGRTVEVSANPAIYQEIVEHPLYAKEVRSLLEERGFHFIQGNGYKSEIFNINDVTGEDAQIWNAVMHNRKVAYMERAIAPALKYFPNIMLTNYGFADEKAWNTSVDAKGGNMVTLGTTASEPYYLRKPDSGYYDTTDGFSNPTTYNNAVYEDTVFNSFLYEINCFKSMYESSDSKRVIPFVAGFNYLHRNRPTNGTRNTAYYSETVLHLGMLNPEVFLGYIVGTRDTNLAGEPYTYDDVIKVVSQLMSELTRVAGYADRKAIEIPQNWNSGFVLSGMYAGGRNIWRLTPDTTVTTLESFRVEGKDPTFRINGQTVTFPGGKIIEDSKISHIGTCGYWIETTANVTPVITSDVDRYRQFPAFGEDFDDYATGMKYSTNNVKYPGSWKFKNSLDAKAVIEDDKSNAGNKVLALSDNVQMQNVKVLENITAGDTCAENQTWEVTVTIPANMGEGKITLLTFDDGSGKVFDGGFRIDDDKLSCYNGDVYVELNGVNISAGGKFTFKRNMRFNTNGTSACDYIVCDANGKELASAKNVSIKGDVKLPLQAIALKFNKVKDVYVDDYKVYASGVAADFMLYDGKLGTPVAELDKARSASTAYRVSWLNGTAYEKVYSVVAAYYNGSKLVEEKIVKKIQMAANTDGVESGVVDVKSGQAVRVYLRDDSKPEPTGDVINSGTTKPDNSKPEPTEAVTVPANTEIEVSEPEFSDDVTDSGDTDSGTTKPKERKTGLIIAVVAGSVLLAAGAAAGVVFYLKKKKAASTEAPAEAPAAEPEEKPDEQGDSQT